MKLSDQMPLLLPKTQLLINILRTFTSLSHTDISRGS